jgi:hypothetical protein
MDDSGARAEAWADASPNPDPAADLGYENAPLVAFPVEESEKRYVVLPDEEVHRSDGEFLVVARRGMRSLDDWR